MDQKVIKLMAQLTLVFVIVWVIASALGKGSQAVPRSNHNRNQRGCGGKWRGQYSNYGSRFTRGKYQPSVAATALAGNDQTVIL